jgi:hypothetical protein
MQSVQFEPMSVGGILDRTFTIYRNNFLRFVTIVAIIQVPIALLSLISGSFLWAGLPADRDVPSEPSQLSVRDSAQAGADMEVPPTPIARDHMRGTAMALFGCIGTAASALLIMVGSMLSQAALTESVSETYLGREVSVGQAYRAILPRFLSLLGASILVTLVVWFGFILLVVPGVIFGLWLFLTTPSIVVEGRRATSGMARSKALASGNLGKIFAVGFLAGLISLVITLPTTYLGGMVTTLLGRNNLMLGMFINRFMSVLSQILATPIGAAASILLYYDLRIRKEGFDLQMLAQTMGSDQG